MKQKINIAILAHKHLQTLFGWEKIEVVLCGKDGEDQQFKFFTNDNIFLHVNWIECEQKYHIILTHPNYYCKSYNEEEGLKAIRDIIKQQKHTEIRSKLA